MGVTVAILVALESSSAEGNIVTRDSASRLGGGSIMLDILLTTEDEDNVHVAEIHQLVENDNLDVSVAFATFYFNDSFARQRT